MPAPDDVLRLGPVVALTYRATVDVPARFRKSKAVGAVFGLTCARYQSGEVDWSGKISRCGPGIRTRRRRTTAPDASKPTTLHTFLPRSMPSTAIFMDLSSV